MIFIAVKTGHKSLHSLFNAAIISKHVLNAHIIKNNCLFFFNAPNLDCFDYSTYKICTCLIHKSEVACKNILVKRSLNGTMYQKISNKSFLRKWLVFNQVTVVFVTKQRLLSSYVTKRNSDFIKNLKTKVFQKTTDLHIEIDKRHFVKALKVIFIKNMTMNRGQIYFSYLIIRLKPNIWMIFSFLLIIINYQFRFQKYV